MEKGVARASPLFSRPLDTVSHVDILAHCCIVHRPGSVPGVCLAPDHTALDTFIQFQIHVHYTLLHETTVLSMHLPKRSLQSLFVMRASRGIRSTAKTMSTTAPFNSSIPQLRRASLDEVPKAFLAHYPPPPGDLQILVLPDGRHMSFAECGSNRPDAQPFINCHGFPGSRLTSNPHVIAMLERLNIRWIGIDRPGIGFSTFHPNSTPIAWISDLRYLLAHLDLPKYRIFSGSGGAAYALAAALLLPRTQLLSVGVVAGIAPPACHQGILRRMGMLSTLR